MPTSAPHETLALAHTLTLQIEHLASSNDRANEALENELSDHRGCLAHITERLLTRDLDEAQARAEAHEALRTHIRNLREVLRDHAT